MCDVGGRRLSEIRVVVLINAPEPSGGPFSQKFTDHSPKIAQFLHTTLFKTFLFLKFLKFKTTKNSCALVTRQSRDPTAIRFILFCFFFLGKNLIKSSSRT